MPPIHRASTRIAVALVLASAFLATAPARAAPQRAQIEAEGHLKRAEQAVAKLQFEEALTHLRAAWALEKAHDTACNIGRIALRLGHKREAAEFLTTCRDMAPPAENAAEEARQTEEREELEAAERAAGALRITVSAPGADVFVDGERVGESPLASKVFVDPGHRRVRAERGAELSERGVDVVPGEVRVVDLKLALPAAPPETPASPWVSTAPALSSALAPRKETAPPPPLPPSSLTPSARRILIATGAVVAATFATGVVHLLVSRDRQVDADDRMQLLQSGSPRSCESGSGPACASPRRAEGDRGREQDITVGLFAGAGVAAAAGGAAAFFVSRW